jgi:hypothetical protein
MDWESHIEVPSSRRALGRVAAFQAYHRPPVLTVKSFPANTLVNDLRSFDHLVRQRE